MIQNPLQLMSHVSDSLTSTSIMKMEIYSEIMRMRKAYGERRIRLRNSLKKLSSSKSRRNRTWKIKNTSLNLLKKRVIGAFQEEEREDIKRLGGVSGNRGDLVEAMMCLKEATTYIDIMIRHPFMMGTPRYRKWSIALDNFLHEMRSMVDYRKPPGHHPAETEDILIAKLRAMKIHEDSAAQKEVRYKLEDAMARLFVSRIPDIATVRMRLMGR